MMRLFIAFPLAVEIKDYLGTVISELRVHSNDIRWVAPKNIHLTARFLGDTEEAKVTKLNQLIDSVAAAHHAVSSSLTELGAFPNVKRPRVIWAGIGEGTEALGKIARDVELRVRQLRFEPESKGFKSHLTLGRVRERARLDKFAEVLSGYSLQPTPILFDRLVLYKSTLTPQGPIYERLHEAPLRGN